MLQGERIALRPFREDDFDAWYSWMAQDVDVSLGGSGTWLPVTAESARKRWQSMMDASPNDLIWFAVDHDGLCIGSITLKHIDRRSQHAWLGIVLDGKQLSRGFGRDALCTMLRWAFVLENFHRISLETWATNERALRCYRAVGFVEEGRMREAAWVGGKHVDVVQMGVLRHEWLESHSRS